MKHSMSFCLAAVGGMGLWMGVWMDQAIAGEPALTTVEITDDLVGVLNLASPPGDFQRLFLQRLQGRIHIIKNGELLATPFLDIDDKVGGGGERGMLGMAFHPQFAANRFIYVRYNANNGDHVVERYTASAANPDVANLASAYTIFRLANLNYNHNGGWIEFGPDGYLYISIGDDQESQYAQDITNQLHGKMLRLDVNSDGFPADPNRNYSIPPDNPFVGVAGDDEIWAFGFRNPWRGSIDRLTGDMWIGDVGSFAWEEIDFEPGNAPGGGNYGWDCFEASECEPVAPCCDDPTMIGPVFEYSHSLGCAVTGGRVYRGCAIPELQGTYFLGDYCSGAIWTFRYDGGVVTQLQELQDELGSGMDIVAFGEDAHGELYICALSGSVFKIVPAIPPADADQDGVPDTCEPVSADLNGDGAVNVDDLMIVINSWGPCAGKCLADLDGNGTVSVDDLLALINSWG